MVRTWEKIELALLSFPDPSTSTLHFLKSMPFFKPALSDTRHQCSHPTTKQFHIQNMNLYLQQIESRFHLFSSRWILDRNRSHFVSSAQRKLETMLWGSDQPYYIMIVSPRAWSFWRRFPSKPSTAHVLKYVHVNTCMYMYVTCSCKHVLFPFVNYYWLRESGMITLI